MRFVPLENHPEVRWCTDCFFSGRETRAVVATEIDVEGRAPLISGLCGNHAEFFEYLLLSQEESKSKEVNSNDETV